MKFLLEVVSCLCMVIIMLYLTGDLPLKPQEEQREGLNIYLLRDASLDIEEAEKITMGKLELSDEPWIAAEDIELYDASIHCMYITKDVSSTFRPTGGSDEQGVLLRGKPFVVTVDGERCYMGYLHTWISSLFPRTAAPMISHAIPGYTTSTLVITQSISVGIGGANMPKPPKTDVRNDPRIIGCLKKYGLYRAGLQLSLDKVEAFKDDDTSLIEYTFTLHNVDQDALWVIDPARMGEGLFHYYSNGVTLMQDADNEHGAASFYADLDQSLIARKPDRLRQVKKEWLTLLKPGESMTRSVLLDGYGRIASAPAKCFYRFSSPTLVEQNKPQLEGGRFWLGSLNAELNTEIRVRQLDEAGEVKARYEKLIEKTAKAMAANIDK